MENGWELMCIKNMGRVGWEGPPWWSSGTEEPRLQSLGSQRVRQGCRKDKKVGWKKALMLERTPGGFKVDLGKELGSSPPSQMGPAA